MRVSDAHRRLQAAKAYENHCAENGRPDDHSTAKELLYVAFACCVSNVVADTSSSAGFAGAFVDREVETRGVSRIDLVASSSNKC